MQSVNELCEKGNSLSEVGMYQEALSCFKHALEKTPETYDYEDERVWILVAIGDTLFQLQQYSKDGGWLIDEISHPLNTIKRFFLESMLYRHRILRCLAIEDLRSCHRILLRG